MATKQEKAKAAYDAKRTEMNKRYPRRAHPGSAGGWLWMHTEFLNRAGIFGKRGPYIIAVYAVLCRYADNNTHECFPSHKTIAYVTGMSVTTVKKCLDILRRNNVILWFHQVYENSADATETNRPNRYRLLDVSAWLMPKPDLRRKDSWYIAAKTADGGVDINAVDERREWERTRRGG